MPDRQRFIVTCTDLHAAFGPFNDLAEAVAMARRMTGEEARTGPSGCVYVPVPFIDGPGFPVRSGGDDDAPMHTGQYL